MSRGRIHGHRLGIPESRTEIVMLRPPDGGSRLDVELVVAGERCRRMERIGVELPRAASSRSLRVADAAAVRWQSAVAGGLDVVGAKRARVYLIQGIG